MDEIDQILLSNCSSVWQKMAKVIGVSMLKIDKQNRESKDDMYFAKRLAALADSGLIEYEGNLSDIRNCEIKLKSEQ